MFSVRLADMIIQIDNRFSYCEEYCKGWICGDSDPDFRVRVTPEEIGEYIIHAGHFVTEPYVENLLIYRKICAIMPLYDRFMFHSAVVSYNGLTVAFSANRGVGKTTHISLWRKYLGDGVKIVSGDKPLIRNAGDEFIVYGTPWNGKERLSGDGFAKLDAVVFLKQAPKNAIRRITDEEYAGSVTAQTAYSPIPEAQNAYAELAAGLIRKIPGYLLECNISEEAVRTVLSELTRKH